MIDNVNARLVFENAKNLLNQLAPQMGYNVKAAKLTQGVIRSEILLNTTNASFKIATLVNDANNAGVIFNTEIRLALQDWFITSSNGIFLAVPTSLTDGSFQYNTFPNPFAFTGGTAPAAYAMYNGYLTLQIDGTLVVPQWDIARHLVIPNQQNVANAYYSVSNQQLQSEISGQNSGFYPVEPNWIFNGAANLDFQLKMPQAMASVQANSRIVIIQRGVKAQNVTSVK